MNLEMEQTKLKMTFFLPQRSGKRGPLFRTGKVKGDRGFEELEEDLEQLLWSEVRRVNVDKSKDNGMG